MSRRHLLALLVLAGEDATWNHRHGGTQRGYCGHQFRDPADRSIYRRYRRRFRRAWRRADAQRAARPADVWPVYGRLSTSTDVLSTSERSAS